MQANNPIQLNTSNTRDLGNYKCKDGKITQPHKFLRSDSLHVLSEADKEVLKNDYDLTCIIDLRSEDEIARASYTFDGVEVVNIPLMDNVQSNSGNQSFPDDMGELYIQLLQNSQSSIKKMFQLFVKHAEHCSLFHCSVGKDRTGTTAMLLLDLVGVDHKQIVIDYQVTEINMEENFKMFREMMKQNGIELPEGTLRSLPSFMEKTLAFLVKEYGNAENYLKHIGITDEEIHKLKNNFAK